MNVNHKCWFIDYKQFLRFYNYKPAIISTLPIWEVRLRRNRDFPTDDDNYAPPPSHGIIRVKQKVMGVPKIWRVDLFPEPVGQFGPLGGHFAF